MSKNLKLLTPRQSVSITAEKVWVMERKDETREASRVNNVSWSPMELLIGMLLGVVAAMLRMM